MNLKIRKNLLLFSLAAETLCVSYGLLPGEQMAVVSVLYLLAGILFVITLLACPAEASANTGNKKISTSYRSASLC
jgi:hypothetical protein